MIVPTVGAEGVVVICNEIGSLIAVGVVTQLKLVVISHVMLPAVVPGSV